MTKRSIFIVAIILLAAILRIYKVDKFPVSLYWDEVALGYNAYSILKTARDEYGKFLPLSFESYQDSKIPGYIYLTVISELFFGLNEFAVRLPSVIFGIGSTLLIFLITKELFYQHKRREIISFLAAFLFSITPWAIQFSRAAFEANGGLFFALLGIYFLLFWLRTGKKLFFCALGVIISLYFYYQQRIFFPLFLILILILFFKKILNRGKEVILLSILSFVFVIPIVFQVFTESGRLSYVSVFKNNELFEIEAKAKISEANRLTARIVHNRYLLTFKILLEAYFKHFSADFLFFHGDPNPRHSVERQGLLPIWTIPFLFLGFLSICRFYDFPKKIVIPWILVSPVAAAFSVPTPHALRSLLLLPPLVITSAIGLSDFCHYVRKFRSGFSIFKILIIFFVLLFTFNYLHLYFVHEKERSLSWADGYKELFYYLKNVEGDYGRIYVTGKYWRPYIFMLFYNQYPPKLHQISPENSKIGKYYFGYASYDTSNPRYDYNQPSLDELRKLPLTLLALSPEEVEENDRVIHTIYSVAGKEVFKIIDNNY